MANRFMSGTLGATCLGVSMALVAPAALAVPDLLETPARETTLAPEFLLNDVARAGSRIVAVGEKGHIIYSDDRGQSWEQGDVPVSVALTGVTFATGQHGWAVGHSGAVLHTSDSGSSWELQFDGMRAAELAIASKEEQISELEARIEQAPEDEKGDLEWALDDIYFTLENIQADMDVGPVNPFLDVWFENANHGFVVGAYGMMFRTKDGGKTWSDWAPKLDNPQSFHLNSITRITGGALVVVGEAGQIHVSVDGGDTWQRRESPYTGSFFGVLGTGQVNEILVFGLRGNTFHSTDIGRNWRVVPNEGGSTINSGAVTDDGRIILVGNGGAVLTSANGGDSFRPQFRGDRDGIMAVVPLSATSLLLVGEGGVKITDSRGRDPK